MSATPEKFDPYSSQLHDREFANSGPAIDPALLARAKLYADRVGDGVKVAPEAVQAAWGQHMATALQERVAADELTGVAATLAERGKRYGDFTRHATICQDLKYVMTCNHYSGYAALSADKKQALDVIADKIARILSGDPEYKDNWHDIQGYAKLAEDRCKE